jgi:hypothetical protein
MLESHVVQNMQVSGQPLEIPDYRVDQIIMNYWCDVGKTWDGPIRSAGIGK